MKIEKRIKIRHLRTFTEIVRLGSFKDAAEALHLTQPAVSRTLSELEDMVGVALLTRDRGGVALTAEGEAFLHFADMGLSAIEQGIGRLKQMRAGDAGRIRIGALPSVAARLLPDAIMAFGALSPGTGVLVEEGLHDVLVDALRRGDLDMIVGRLGPPETMGGVSFTQLYLEHVAFVVRAGHPLTGTRDVARIADHPVIYPSPTAAIRPLVDRMMMANGISNPPRTIESVSGAFGRSLTLSSDAVWIISEGVVAQDVDAGRLVRLDVDAQLTSGPVGIMVRADEEAGPLVGLFRRAITGALA